MTTTQHAIDTAKLITWLNIEADTAIEELAVIGGGVIWGYWQGREETAGRLLDLINSGFFGVNK